MGDPQTEQPEVITRDLNQDRSRCQRLFAGSSTPFQLNQVVAVGLTEQPEPAHLHARQPLSGRPAFSFDLDVLSATAEADQRRGRAICRWCRLTCRYEAECSSGSGTDGC